MRRINLRGGDEEHNFWQNYTDLMSGLMIVFLIAAATSVIRYIELESDYKLIKNSNKDASEIIDSLKNQNSELKVALSNKDSLLTHIYDITGQVPGQGESLDSAIHHLVSNAELYEQVKAFDEAQRRLESQYFTYDTHNHRFICKLFVEFAPDRYEWPKGYKTDTLALAGKELEAILSPYQSSKHIGFKVIIDGRAAREKTTDQSHINVDVLSYQRARQLYYLWRKNGIIARLEELGADVSVAGSGFYGSGRFPYEQEWKNKQFIIQVIPYIKF